MACNTNQKTNRKWSNRKKCLDNIRSIWVSRCFLRRHQAERRINGCMRTWHFIDSWGEIHKNNSRQGGTKSPRKRWISVNICLHTNCLSIADQCTQCCRVRLPSGGFVSFRLRSLCSFKYSSSHFSITWPWSKGCKSTQKEKHLLNYSFTTSAPQKSEAEGADWCLMRRFSQTERNKILKLWRRSGRLSQKQTASQTTNFFLLNVN